MPYQQFDKVVVIIHGIIAIFGGIANALTQEEVRFIKFIYHVVVSAFTGIMAAFIMLHFTEPNYLTYAVSGSFGYAGKEGMEYILNFIKKSFQANIK